MAEEIIYNNTTDDNLFLNHLMFAINNMSNGAGCRQSQLEIIDELYRKTSFYKLSWRIILVLYAPMTKRIWVSRICYSSTFCFSKVLAPLLKHRRIFEFKDKPFRIQMDVMENKPIPTNISMLNTLANNKYHFEMGVDGLLFTGPDKKTQIFLPGDAYVRSILTADDLRKYLYKIHGEEYVKNSIFYRFNTESYVSSTQNTFIRLYRGHPIIPSLNKSDLENTIDGAIDHIKYTQDENGKFLYYYDTAYNTRIDHEHPKRNPNKNPYYNIIRHACGGLNCIFYEKYTKSKKSLNNIKLSIDYFVEHAVEYEYNQNIAAYIYSEKKSKLGSVGTGLYLISNYQLLFDDDSYKHWADKFAWHIISQITESGEFIYYNIYLDKEMDLLENKNYFSFYYPGEAICGLSSYLRIADDHMKNIIIDKLKKALNFLIVERPVIYRSHFNQLPSDAWLMMGINELWDFPQFRNKLYSKFVFDDARKMMLHMYTPKNALYHDYKGCFYYTYGDFPYADGARSEGLLAAFELALKTKDDDFASTTWRYLKMSAWALLHLVNTKESLYFAKRPDLAQGAIRFKHTRQWFRIDTIQHVASFFAKMLPYWDRFEKNVEKS